MQPNTVAQYNALYRQWLQQQQQSKAEQQKGGDLKNFNIRTQLFKDSLKIVSALSKGDILAERDGRPQAPDRVQDRRLGEGVSEDQHMRH